jgi:hypothetical protein
MTKIKRNIVKSTIKNGVFNLDSLWFVLLEILHKYFKLILMKGFVNFQKFIIKRDNIKKFLLDQCRIVLENILVRKFLKMD